jgi:hypothetical protein
MSEKTPEVEKEVTIEEVVADIVLNYNKSMIAVLNKYIGLANNKHEKRAYQNVIDYIRKNG